MLQAVSCAAKHPDQAYVCRFCIVDIVRVSYHTCWLYFCLSFPMIMRLFCLFCRCVVSPVGILTPILDYTRCFLNHPYEQNAQIINDSDLPVKYDLIPQVKTKYMCNPSSYTGAPSPDNKKYTCNPCTFTRASNSGNTIYILNTSTYTGASNLGNITYICNPSTYTWASNWGNITYICNPSTYTRASCSGNNICL